MTVEQVELIVYELASEFYPDYPDPMPVFQYLGGDYGRGLLDSALSQPRQTHGGRFLYRSIFDKAAVLLCSMIKNHPFLDGNKRMALTTVSVFLTFNNRYFYAQRDEAVARCLTIASTPGNVDWRPLSRWLRQNSINARKLQGMTQAQKRKWAKGVSIAVSTMTRTLDYIISELDKGIAEHGLDPPSRAS